MIECVPNISEGRNPETIAAVAKAITTVPGVYLLDQTSDWDHNRTVFTFAGEEHAVVQAALALVRECVHRIQLALHQGVHPRVGAADVVPLVPLRGVTLAQTADLAHSLGASIWRDLSVPVYFYEAAALRERTQRLEQVRNGFTKGLAPDVGTGKHPTGGAVCVGARKFLIAWNINLRTEDLSVAKRIAKEIRESSGGLPGVKALGLALESRRQSQVSINLVDFEATPLHVVFAAAEKLCREQGVEIAGSELIGLIPEAALALSRGYDLRWNVPIDDCTIEARLAKLR